MKNKNMHNLTTHKILFINNKQFEKKTKYKLNNHFYIR
jgi:hypothetical protein